jgi:DNA-directed RNA polymerase subunit RPC12/RpoP
MVGNFKRYNLLRRPRKPMRVLSPVAWALSFPKVWRHRAKIDKTGFPKGIKPPYLLLCNHNSFMDFKVMTRAIFPRRASYIVAIDGFIGRDWLLRAVGGVCNRKFSRSTSLVRSMLAVRDNGVITVLFPEARYSLCGTSAVLPASLGKMARLMGVPVVTLIMHGHHVNSPYWAVGNRKVRPVEAEMRLLFTKEEVRSLPVAELNARLAKAFEYDDFAWQKAKGLRVCYKRRAEGLHKVLYQCPACRKEYHMSSSGHRLVCEACGKSWLMGEDGRLTAESGETEFAHIPHWYEWQRANVKEEVESGRYRFECSARVESLPNAKGFVVFPEPARLVHTAEGFTLTGVCLGEPFTVSWPAKTLYSCHIEYDYMGRGDCVDLNTDNDTFYTFPQDCRFSVTKISLATEESHKLSLREGVVPP